MMPVSRADTGRDNRSLLSPNAYDDDASSIHSRSDQDTDSDDDELQQRARNSRELLAHDRIVLMEEEETDRLVTKSRRQQQEQQRRRSSGLGVPNALSGMLGRRLSLGTVIPAASEPRARDVPKSQRSRRSRRSRRKKDSMMENACDGEDGGLMYEMEERGVREDASTGQSTPRDDSDEVDRRRLDSVVADAKARRGRSWRRWVLIHSLIAIGFAILVLLAWKLSRHRKSDGPSSDEGQKQSMQQTVSNGTALFAPTTIIISLDGFRADFLQRGLTPRLNALIKEGVSPLYMRPSFPSVTFPNHHTLATGLYPESHGVVGNSFWDPALMAEFYYTDPARSLDAKWWGGEPFWVTAEKQGVRTAVHMWPGSEAHIFKDEPSYLDRYNGKEKLERKVSRILELLDKPGQERAGHVAVEEMRPQVIAAYVPNVDAAGHQFGPNSTEIRDTISSVDKMLDGLFAGLEQRNLTAIVNIMIVSDHGMATTDASRLMQLEDLVDTSQIEHIDGWPLYGLRPKRDADLQSLYDDVKQVSKTNDHFDVYLRDVDMPPRYHFSNNERIAPLWIVPKTGWAIATKKDFDVVKGQKEGLIYHPRGLHGYDHEHPLMRAIFIARGPAFPHPANSQLEPFQNIEVYNMLCDSVGVVPKPNNGTLRLPLKPIGVHKPGETAQEVVDPPQKESEPPAAPKRPLLNVLPMRPVVPPRPSDDKKEAEQSIGERVKKVLDWVSDEASQVWKSITGNNKADGGSE